MERGIKFEGQSSFKLKNITGVNCSGFSMDSPDSSAHWRGPPHVGREISLILGNSFSLENPVQPGAQASIYQQPQIMRNKKTHLKLGFSNPMGRAPPWQNSTGQNNRIPNERNLGDFEDLLPKQLDRSRSTACNMALEEEEDDERELENFLRQREGFKKHCEDLIEEEGRDPNFLSDDEINSIIREKMKILDIYNVVVLKQGKDDIDFRWETTAEG